MENQHNISIKSLNIKNFKSFNNLNLNLDKFNVIAGPNAAGKSNFMQIFSFLKDIVTDGLDNAIALQGGDEYLLNFIDKNKNIVFEITFDTPMLIFSMPPTRNEKLLISDNTLCTAAVYRFEIKLCEQGKFKILRDIWNLNLEEYADENFTKLLSSGTGTIESKQDRLEIYLKFPDKNLDRIILKRASSQSLSVEDNFVTRYMLLGMDHFLRYIGIYDFDPKPAKSESINKGKNNLESTGSNLAIVLKNIIKNSKQKKQFYNHITHILPFISAIDTRYQNKSAHFVVREDYFKDRDLLSTFISDGTANIIAIIVALYFQSNQMSIIEEPEKNIHPALMSRVVNMLDDASQKTQIIVTTHSPEIVRYAGIERILIIHRNKNGYSEVTKPNDLVDVTKLLRDGMDIGELYTQNLLGG